MPLNLIPRICRECGSSFLVHTCKVRNGFGIYCSKHCARLNDPKPSLEERFWNKVEKSDGCWIWTGSRKGMGYGEIGVGRKILAAHRVSWEIHYGPIPDGLWVLHSCDNPPCVRPDHLFLGDRQDNMDDMVDKGRSQRGATHSKAKLTDADVLEIRRRNAIGETGTRKLAAEFGVRRNTIVGIIKRVYWKHI